MLCFASFATVLSLGGGPQATTIELAIFQALSYDYDPARAAMLALIQMVCCLGAGTAKPTVEQSDCAGDDADAGLARS